MKRPLLILVLLLGSPFALAATLTVDDALPDGGDCQVFGSWEPLTTTCRIGDGQLLPGDVLFIKSGTVVIDGTFLNEGRIDNHDTLVVNGFLNSPNDVVNFWTATLINRGQFFSHFMYNFGTLINLESASVEFQFHLENNAPMLNYGHIDITGNYINIPGRILDNRGTLTIGATGTLSNDGRVVNAGEIVNSGVAQNGSEWIEHCGGAVAGNPVEGDAPVDANVLTLGVATLDWCPVAGAVGYDVVSGELELLRISGDFGQATCLSDGLAALSTAHGAEPLPGQGRWFLLAADGVDFDTPYASQSASRHPAIGAACP